MRHVISMKMKTAPTLILGICILASGFVPITAHSQSASLQEPPQKIEHLNIPGQSTLEEAVQHLQRNLPKGQQQLNVIYGEGAESLKVPSLTVRNVTGPDALMLIATATDVQLEPIGGIDEKVVGYKLWKQPAAFNLLGTRYGGISKSQKRGRSHKLTVGMRGRAV